MEKLSERFMYYSGILVAMKGAGIVDDLKHIQNLLDAEEQGLLLKLPCKVGDVIYSIEYRKRAKIVEERVVSFEIVRDCIYVYAEYDKFIGRLGCSVFATKAEAEKALAEMKGE